ncbi:ORF_104 [Adoxophyes orana granulovirus]|uniref:ADOR105 n=1 Tax=Adoxophyes orana granulovirus TaxID=170617 RepID=Q7T9R1_GVAO|nr:ORF_104 [Adoxophyes orana granulovirus]AAP85741.1 ORF_104 [Adoxophyes orana granulovirus]AJA91745.1 ADOR105 [Adoxophyes orana granulovirus]
MGFCCDSCLDKINIEEAYDDNDDVKKKSCSSCCCCIILFLIVVIGVCGVLSYPMIVRLLAIPN